MARRFRSNPSTLRRPVVALSIAVAFGVAAAGAAHAQVAVDVDVTAQSGWLYDLGAVVSLFIDPPVYQPEPIAVAWAPPPMLVEEPPPQPDPSAYWTGGYWTWQGDWVWCAGRWMDPPRQEYVWVQPYYEHRDDRVIFIPGYWSSPDVEFVAPPMERSIPWAFVNAGVVIGPRPEGPAGIFVPPPPGSRPGLIVPAPIGTPPSVVISAPPVMAVGMRVTGAVAIDARHTINDNRVTNYSVANVRNVTNVTVEAPAAATASGRAFQAQVPHQAHLAAALHPQVAARAPAPSTRTAVPTYVSGHAIAALPAPQKVQGLPAVPPHGAATVSQAQRAQMGHAPMTPAEARQARAGGREIDTEHLPPTAAGPQGAHPPQPAAAAQVRPGVPQAEQQRAQALEQQRTQQEQAQRAEQQHATQEQVQQRAQMQEQQRTQQEQAQRAEQQHAAQAQAQQRAQAQEQQRAQQEQAQRAEKPRAPQEQAQRVPQRSPQERGESARPRGEEASRPSN